MPSESTGSIERGAPSQRHVIVPNVEVIFRGKALLYWTRYIDVNYISSVKMDVARVFLVASPDAAAA